MQLVNEEPNPVYCELLSGLKNKTVEIESIKERIAGISASLDKLQQEHGELQVKCLEKSSRKKEHEEELDYYKTTLDTLKNHYQEIQRSFPEGRRESFNVVSLHMRRKALLNPVKA